MDPMDNEVNKKFLSLCENGEFDEIPAFCEENSPVSFFQDENGQSALHLVMKSKPKAKKLELLDIVQYLLEYGVPWNLIDEKGHSCGTYCKDEKVYDFLIGHGCRSELILSGLHGKSEGIVNEDYLKQRLQYTSDCKLIDEEKNGVMMGWEKIIMVKSCEAMLKDFEKNTATVLNVGFGLGLIDTEIQKYEPKKHIIIEAHPDVLKHMKETGWYDKPGVVILEGRWQDVFHQIPPCDAVYFDTFGEEYDQMRDFHELLFDILKQPDGIYSFFNGLAARDQLFHDVSSEIARLELLKMGLECKYEEMKIDPTKEEWKGVKDKYWQLPIYHLPIVKWMK